MPDIHELPVPDFFTPGPCIFQYFNRVGPGLSPSFPYTFSDANVDFLGNL